MQIFFWSTTFCFFFLLSVSKRATSELQTPGSNSTEDERHPASVSVECREPLLGSASWECAIGERELPPKSPEEDGAWELLEGIDGDNGENGTAMNSNQSVAVQAGPLAVYHSFKVGIQGIGWIWWKFWPKFLSEKSCILHHGIIRLLLIPSIKYY